MSERVNLEEENDDLVSKRSSLIVGKIPTYKDRALASPAQASLVSTEVVSPQKKEEAQEEERVAVEPRAKSSEKNGALLSMRVGTRGADYVRQKDKVSTIRFNFVSSKKLYERERKFAVTHEYPMTRNKWLEKVISEAIDAEEAARTSRTKKRQA